MDGAGADSLYPIAVLIDELKNEDITLRLNSIRKLSTIALALGEDRTVRELIPFLKDSTDDEDEVLLAMADELGNFVQYVGGSRNAFCLLDPLEQLAMVEETVVRDKAVESINKVNDQISDAHIAQYSVPMLKRLVSAELFPARVSSCSMFVPIYKRCPSHLRVELRQSFARLCRDDTPMVRRAAASNLAKFAHAVEAEAVAHELLPLLIELTNDDQDSVRLLAVEGCGGMARLLPKADLINSILPVVKTYAGDKSWRVRYNVAQQLVNMCEAFGVDTATKELTSLYARLLGDNEAEVRVAASSKLADVSRLLQPSAVTQQILPCVKTLAQDSSQYVRSAVAGSVMELAPIVGKDMTVTHLLPLFLDLLKDDIPEVRLNIISKLDHASKVIGIDLLSQSLLPAIQELSEDQHWRVRLAIIEHVPLLARQLGQSFFQDKLGAQCMKWLEDKVYSIREAATKILAQLAKEFGEGWVRDIIPKVVDMSRNPHYLYRLSILWTLHKLAAEVSRDTLCTAVLPVVMERAKDRVANVKFNVAKVLQGVVPLVDRAYLEGTVKPCLKELLADPDFDVKYHAFLALEACNSAMA